MGNDALGTLLAVLALLLTIMGYKFRRPALGFAGAGIWIIFALFSLQQTTAVWDIYYGMFWVGIGLAIVVVLETFVLRPKKEEEEPEEQDNWDTYGDKMEKQREKMNRVRRLTIRHRVIVSKDGEEENKRKVRKMLK